MEYNQISINLSKESEDIAEILTAFLADIGYDSFENDNDVLKAYIPLRDYNEHKIRELLGLYNLDFELVKFEDRNWNEVWEQNFNPILVDDDLYIRATFHKSKPDIPYEIIIDPKMSFGTGHHETTFLMCKMLFKHNKSMNNVLDMGCGTGILAILAKKLDAINVYAIDFDEWSTLNSQENIERNNCSDIKIILGEANSIPDIKFDLILANINLNVLLADIPIYSSKMLLNGKLVLSGFYISDIEAIKDKSNQVGLEFEEYIQKNDWVSCSFIKKTD